MQDLLKRSGCTRGSGAVLAAVILLIGCRGTSAPEQALTGYIRSVREHRCDAAMNFLSARTRRAIQSLIERPQHPQAPRSEEHTSELQSQSNLVCRLLLEKNKHTRTWPS